MKTKLITITLVSLVAVLVLVPLPFLNQADAQIPPSPGGPGVPLPGTLNIIAVEFEQAPLFNEANFAPGDSVGRWIKVTNNSGQTQRIATEAIDVSDPDRLGDVLNLKIKEGGITRYNDTFSKFFTAGEIYLSDLGSGEQIQYDFIVTFYSGAGNPFQGKSLGFDILIGFQGTEGGLLPGAGGGLPRGLTIQDESIITTGISETSVTITWLTTYMSTSQVIYAAEGESHTLGLTDNTGTPPKYGYAHVTPEDLTKVTFHSVTIAGLTPGTTYYYRTVSYAALSPSSVYSGYFSGTEINTGNTFYAGTLDFSLALPAADFSPQITPTQSSSRTINVRNEGSLGFQYTVQTANAIGSLCNYLSLVADLDGNNKYTGSLTSFNYNVGEFSAPEDWIFAVSLTSNDAGLQNRTCTFDFIYSGTQIGSAGFSDTETFSNTVTAGLWNIWNIRGISYDFTFKNDLWWGMEGEEVEYLQIILAEERSEIYPESLVTGHFGDLTKKAVQRFQKKYEIEMKGVVDIETRTKLNELLNEYRLKVRDRIDITLEGIKEFYGRYTLPTNFPQGIILGIAAQETGRRYNFNNAFVNDVVVSGDFGRGIMQVTSDEFVGAGSCSDELCKRCQVRDKEACLQYYSNTEQGVKANIRDGIYGLDRKYIASGYCENCTEQEDFTWEEVCWISIVQRYNIKSDIPTEYVWNVGDRLKNLRQNWYYAEEIEDYSALGEKFIRAYEEGVKLGSSAYLQVYDSQMRTTGLIEGEVREEIPNSIYDKEEKVAMVLFPSDFYRYRVVGTEEGTYKLTIFSARKEKKVTFNAIDIPTSAGAVHQYTIDWDALSQGEKGVTLQIDADGDGIFDQTVTADNDLTYDEFILQTDTIIDFDPDTLNLNSKGKFVTVYIELPEGYAVSQIDIPSIILNGSVPALAKPTEIGDYDKDGTPDLMVKFDRFNVQTILSLGNEVPVTITGKVFHNGNYIDFKGSDMIRVVDPGGSKK